MGGRKGRERKVLKTVWGRKERIGRGAGGGGGKLERGDGRWRRGENKRWGDSMGVEGGEGKMTTKLKDKG